MPSVQLTLPASGIRPEAGRAYFTRIPRPPLRDFVRLKMDSPDAPHATLLELYEDERRLGPYDSLPDFVRKNGMGAFARRGRELFLSASDDSSPITNQRTYFVRAPLTPTPLFWLLGWIALLMAFWRFVLFLPPAQKRSVVRAIRRTIRWLAVPRQLGGHGLLFASIALS